MPFLTLTIAAICGIVLLYAAYKKALPRPIPGVPYNPEAVGRILGDIPSLAAELAKTGDVVAWFRDQNLKSGVAMSQVFIYPFWKPILLVGDYKTARDVMLHRIRDFDRSSLVTDSFGGIVKSQQFTLKTGPEWKLHRRLVQDTMSPDFLRKVASHSIHASTQRFIDLWDIKTRLANGSPFSATQDIFYFGLDAVLAFSFGSSFPHSATMPQIQLLNAMTAEQLSTFGSTTDQEVQFPVAEIDPSVQSMRVLGDTLGQVQGSTIPHLKWLWIKSFPSFRRWMTLKDGRIREEITKAAENRRKSVSNMNGTWISSAVDHVIDREERLALKEGRNADIHSSMIIDEIFGFILAGHDTTSSTMCWGVKLLADHPEAQLRLRKALQSALKIALAEKRTPTVEEILQTPMPLLEATIEEILRCGTTVPWDDREAVRDTTLLGHHVPKGTWVFFLQNSHSLQSPALHVDDSLRSEKAQLNKDQTDRAEWDAEDIARFKPERWLVTTQDGDKQSVTFNAQAGPSIPFGIGVRSCFGRRLAYIAIRIMLTMLIWNFELLECPKHLSSYHGRVLMVYKPQQCYVRLKKVIL